MSLCREGVHEIGPHLITARSNRRTDGDNEIGRTAAELARQCFNCRHRNACRRASPPGVNGAHGACPAVSDEQRYAIGRTNDQRHVWRVGDERVRARCFRRDVCPDDGDFAAIESHDLPILRVHLGQDPDAGLAALERALAAALDNPTEA